MRIAFRTVSKNDFIFLKRLYRSTREQELAAYMWNEEQKQSFIEFQFNAQHAHYINTYKNAEFKIILLNREEIGRLYFEETDKHIRLIDISLLPEFQGKGTGTNILNTLINKTKLSSKKLNLHVKPDNPAYGLYCKLGFKVIEKNNMHYFMEYLP